MGHTFAMDLLLAMDFTMICLLVICNYAYFEIALLFMHKSRTVSQEHYQQIESKMSKIASENQKFERLEMSKKDLKEMFEVISKRYLRF